MKEEILLLLSKYFYYKPVELRKILEGFKNPENIMEAPKDAFLKLGVSGKALDGFIKSRNFEIKEVKESDGIKTTTILDADYPAALKNIYDPPPILL